jgi:hypothetical protein
MRLTVLSFAATHAELLYAAPSHLACIMSGHRQYELGNLSIGPALYSHHNSSLGPENGLLTGADS